MAGRTAFGTKFGRNTMVLYPAFIVTGFRMAGTAIIRLPVTGQAGRLGFCYLPVTYYPATIVTKLLVAGIAGSFIGMTGITFCRIFPIFLTVNG